MRIAIAVAVCLPCLALAEPVQFDLMKAANKDVILESGFKPKADPFGANVVAAACFVEDGYKDTKGARGVGLPKHGAVPSTDPALGTYMLLPFNQENVVELTTTGDPVTREIRVPERKYEKIGLLVAGVDGDTSFTLQIEYADGTIDANWFEADDWWDLGPRANLAKAVRDMDRADARTGLVEDAKHYNLYEFIFDKARGLDPDKAIKSITIGNTPNRWPDGDSKSAGVFAINGAALAK